ncbi:MAG: hypothetical protein FJ146_18580 [Deltaproteobacteria bacterium]|nr:hypothetical protein [Deltaproteobacteria bacterium]
MGARAKEKKVELMVNRREFFDRVGMVTNYYELEWLGLSGHDFCGLFLDSSFPELLKFCGENPDYHLVSSVGVGCFVNRIEEGADFFMIAKGEKNQNLELNYLLDPQWALIYEEGMAAAIAEIDNIKNSQKS